MMRKMILTPMREGEGSKVDVMVVMLSVAILSVALLMFIVVFQPTISQSTMTAVHAESSSNVVGIWTYINTYLQMTNQADGNTFIYGAEKSIWSGTFEGKSYDIFTKTMYLSGPMTFEGQIDFNGKVKDKVGTLVILFLGQAIRKDELRVSGQWSILSGTGDLANLRGEGSFWGYGGYLTYIGQIYFE